MPSHRRRASSDASDLSGTTAQPEATRSYQFEMLELSKRRNIIVAMDTGSGKTHIAKLRIEHELDKGRGLICWFLVPGVTLAEQQFSTLSASLPAAVNYKLITGKDGPDKWSTQDIWDKILGHKEAVVVSTHQVLLDALTHGFVKMRRLGLLVFDEAHHCLRNHPANDIMQNFYHPARKLGTHIPDILGLTASPVMNTKIKQLDEIERNLNAITKTPIQTRDDLMRMVQHPKLRCVVYGRKDREPLPPDAGVGGVWNDELGGVVEAASAWNDGLNEVVEVAGAWNDDELGGVVGPAVGGRITWDEHLDVDLGSESKVPLLAAPEAAPAVAAKKRKLTRPTPRAPPPPEESDSEYEEIDPYTSKPLVKRNPNDMAVDESDEADINGTDGGVSLSSTSSSSDYQDIDNLDNLKEIDPITGKPLPPTSDRPAPQKLTFLPQSATLKSLKAVYDSMDMCEDPYVISLQDEHHSNLERSLTGAYDESELRKRLQSALDGGTYTREHLKSLITRGTHILEECGVWATDWFVGETVTRLLQKGYAGAMSESTSDSEQEESSYGVELRDEEEAYLRRLLQRVNLVKPLGPIEAGVTEKIDTLIDVLLDEYAHHAVFSGLVFVQQRVAAIAVREILAQHPKTKMVFKTDTMVGSSTSTHKKSRALRDLLPRNSNTLQNFRTGALNLVVTTSVIEEGLDIQACCSVVCFSPPTSLKSFVQRRGRARMAESNYVIMLGATERSQIKGFEDAEKEMIEKYKEARELAELEGDPDEEEPGCDKSHRIEETGALLTLKNSTQHLDHFCATIPKEQHVNNKPQYILDKDHTVLPDTPAYSATVILPNSIHPDIRRHSGRRLWKSNKWAYRDAAFEAMLKLHEHGMLNDHWLPLLNVENIQEVEKRSPTIETIPRKDPWEEIEEKWESNDLYLTTIVVEFSEGRKIEVDLLLPIELPEIEPLKLCWTVEETATITYLPSRQIGRDPEIIEKGRRATYRLLKAMHANRMEEGNCNFAYLFVPNEEDPCRWDELPEEPMAALEAFREGVQRDLGLVRDKNGTPYVFNRFREDADLLEASEFQGKCGRDPTSVIQDQPLLEVTALSKRRDFLHSEAGKGRRENKTLLLLPEFFNIDRLPERYSQFSQLVPFVIDRVEKALLAADLNKALNLADALPNIPLVHAVTASSARDPTDYQRLEFLGDSVLKCLTSVALVDEHPLWHEGYLSARKDLVVSNKAAADAADSAGLAQFINTAPFTASKWSARTMPIEPITIESTTAVTTATAHVLSTKTLADIVESVLGVSYLSGGYITAGEAISRLQLAPTLPFKPLPAHLSSLKKKAELTAPTYAVAPHFTVLESLLDYTFHNRGLLLEAITHLSFVADATTLSYQRLEFVGDSILDMVVTSRLYRHPARRLGHEEMHLYRSSVVSAHFLSYLALSASVPFTPTPGAPTRNIPLHRFLRHACAPIDPAAAAAQKRFHKLQRRLKTRFVEGNMYPWSDLVAVNAPKFMSDIVESLVGAIWIDSDGDFAAVERFLEKLGLWVVLERLVTDEVGCEHPRGRLGRKVANGGRDGEVKYKVEMRAERWWAEVRVDGKCLGEAWGTSRGHVGTLVAEVGLREVERLEKTGEWPWKKEEKDGEKKAADKGEEEGGGVELLGDLEEVVEDEEFFDALDNVE